LLQVSPAPRGVLVAPERPSKKRHQRVGQNERAKKRKQEKVTKQYIIDPSKKNNCFYDKFIIII
jgi:hypothetical protein